MEFLKKNYVAVILALVIAGTALKIKGLFGWSMDDGQPMPKFNLDASNLSIDAEHAKYYADVLHDAMRGAGTEEEDIVSVLQMLLVPDDFMYVFEMFGKRQYIIDGQAIWPFTYIAQKHDLAQWMKRELSEGEEAYQMFQARCKASGIPF